NIIIPGSQTAAASAVGHGNLFNFFMVTGGTGDVNVNFSVNLTGNLNGFTDAFGQAVQSETTFALELDGTPILFRNDLFAVGPNGSDSRSFSQSLFDT